MQVLHSARAFCKRMHSSAPAVSPFRRGQVLGSPQPFPLPPRRTTNVPLCGFPQCRPLQTSRAEWHRRWGGGKHRGQQVSALGNYADSTSMVETSTRVEGRVLTHNDGWVPEHLKHPLKTVDQYWSPVSDRGQMASSGDVVTPYIPIMAMWRVTRF